MSGGLLHKIKRMIMEPKVFALTARSVHGQVLYLGVHYTWEEAYAAARAQLDKVAVHGPLDEVTVDQWNILMARDALTAMFEPGASIPTLPLGQSEPNTMTPTFSRHPVHTLDQAVGDLKKARNTLMKDLINKGDVRAVEALRGTLTTREIRYIKVKIAKKLPTVTPGV